LIDNIYIVVWMDLYVEKKSKELHGEKCKYGCTYWGRFYISLGLCGVCWCVIGYILLDKSLLLFGVYSSVVSFKKTLCRIQNFLISSLVLVFSISYIMDKQKHFMQWLHCNMMVCFQFRIFMSSDNDQIKDNN
jgi:hypothetical protein